MSSFNNIYGIQEDDNLRYSSIIVNPDEFYVDNYDYKTQTNEEHHYTFERNNIIEKSDIMEEPRPIYGDTIEKSDIMEEPRPIYGDTIEKSDIMEEPRPIYGDTYIAKLSVDQIV
ncbi:MAG: hypothetical protein ACPKPY_11580, partial [Nitrososphaeraceae archaeon]